MVLTATSLGRTGLQDWIIQRFTAIILAIYTAFLLFYFILNPDLTYDDWQQLFNSEIMQYGSLLALVSLIAHAWIGIWTVTTDYIKHAVLRLLIQVFFLLFLLGNFFWGIQILWGL